MIWLVIGQFIIIAYLVLVVWHFNRVTKELKGMYMEQINQNWVDRLQWCEDNYRRSERHGG
jgi:hypothetical protein